MTNFTTARPPQETRFADAVGGEVVMQHKIIKGVAAQGIDTLFIDRSAQSCGDHGLSLAPGKKG